MKTQMLSAQRPEDIAAAAGLLRSGKLVAIPTETVYGLGANGLDENAVLRIFEAKGRPQDNPLILHISEPKELESICHDIPAQAWLLAEHFWPGPLTMVLPVRDLVPKRTTAGLDTVAVRCPKTAATRELIRLAGVPIAAPSANRSGKPSTTTAAHVLHDMDGRIEAILDGGPCEVGVESTIVDLTGERPRLLRPGGVTPEELRALLGELDIDRAVLGQIANDAVVRAPGMKYKHLGVDALPRIQQPCGLVHASAVADGVKAQNRPEGLLFCVLPAHLLFLTEQQPHHLKADLRFLAGGLDSGEISLSSVFLDCPKVVIELL